MSLGNVAFELTDGVPFEKPVVSPTRIINVADATYGKVCVFGTVLPTSGALSTENVGTGFAPGCILVNTTNAKLYINTGTTATADFTELTT